MKTLHLTINKKWFDMLGEKTEEYREIKGYWISRLCIDFSHSHDEDGENFLFKPKEFDIVLFRNGYHAECSTKSFAFNNLEIRNGNTTWGAEPDKKYFVILLGNKL